LSTYAEAPIRQNLLALALADGILGFEDDHPMSNAANDDRWFDVEDQGRRYRRDRSYHDEGFSAPDKLGELLVDLSFAEARMSGDEAASSLVAVELEFDAASTLEQDPRTSRSCTAFRCGGWIVDWRPKSRLAWG
jgi:hypothetical protein